MQRQGRIQGGHGAMPPKRGHAVPRSGPKAQTGLGWTGAQTRLLEEKVQNIIKVSEQRTKAY